MLWEVCESVLGVLNVWAYQITKSEWFHIGVVIFILVLLSLLVCAHLGFWFLVVFVQLGLNYRL